MGISTIHSYRGAQIFEAVGLSQELVDQHFTWTASRIGGIGMESIETDVLRRHQRAYLEPEVAANQDLDPGGGLFPAARGRLARIQPSSGSPSKFRPAQL